MSARIAKLTPPFLNKVYPRTRLFAQLNDCRKRPINWLCAPAGYGKTTLVASYIHHFQLPALWYQVDEGDNDIASFFYYLGVAVQNLVPGKTEMPIFTPEHQAGDVAAFARHFFRELYQCLPVPSVLVLDNFQDAPQGIFHDMIKIALQEIPQGLNVIVVSRSEPLGTLSCLRASHRFAMLDTESLALTDEETTGIGLLYYPNYTSNDLKILHAQTRGWVTGLILLLEEARHGSLPTIQSVRHESLFNFFAGEVFNRADTELKEFLLKTAYLPVLSLGEVEALTGFAKAEDFLAELAGKNYFTYHRKDGGAYEYHPLFRAFLQNRAESYFSRERAQRIQQQAVEILLQSNHVEVAVTLLLEIGDWTQAARTIAAHAQILFEQGRSRTLMDWIGALPPELVRQSTWLNYWVAAVKLIRVPQESRPLFEQCFVRFESEGDIHGMYAAWVGVVESIWYAQAGVTALDEWLEKFSQLQQLSHGFSDAQLEAKVIPSLILALIWRRPDHPELPQWLERAETLWRQMPNENARFQLGARMAFYLGASGRNLAKAKSFCVIDEPGGCGANKWPAGMIVFGRLILAFIHCFNGRPQAALENAQTALDESDAKGLHVLDSMLLTVAIFSSLYLGNNKKADLLLRRMNGLVANEQDNINTAYFYMLTAWRAAVAGHHVQAGQNADMALGIMQQMGAVFPEAICRLMHAYVGFERGDFESSLNQLQGLIQICAVSGYQWITFMAHGLSAGVLLKQHDEIAALPHLRQAMQIGSRCHYGQPLLFSRDMVAELYSAALAHNIEREYVMDCIHQGGLLPPGGVQYVEHWPWPVKIATLGSFSVNIHNQLITVSSKAQQKPMGLLKALVAMGGSEVSQSKLTDQLWPDADGDAARRAFNTTLHRLRKSLGHDEAFILKDGKLSLNRNYCSVDIWIFERQHDELLRLLQEAESTERDNRVAVLSQSLIRLYQGEFLECEPDESWALPYREKLHHRMINMIRQLSRHYEKHEQYENALALCEKGLEIDPLLEEFYQTTMRINMLLNRHGEVIAAYNRCKRTLRSSLGIMPSPMTERFRQQLQGKGAMSMTGAMGRVENAG